jgi:cytochrome c-type biogenesis protein CcmH
MNAVLRLVDRFRFRRRRTQRGSLARGLFRVVLILGATLLLVPAFGSRDAVGSGHVDHGGSIGIQNETERQLFFSLICTCGCPRETLGTCTCDYGSARRDELREMLAAGKTIAQAQEAYGKRFGPQSIAVPPNQGANRLIWAIPLVAVIAGAVFLAMMMKRWSKANAKVTAAAAAPTNDASGDAALDAQLDAELRDLDRE